MLAWCLRMIQYKVSLTATYLRRYHCAHSIYVSGEMPEFCRSVAASLRLCEAKLIRALRHSKDCQRGAEHNQRVKFAMRIFSKCFAMAVDPHDVHKSDLALSKFFLAFWISLNCK